MKKEMVQPLLSTKNLNVSFHTDNGLLPAVRDLELTLYPGEILGLVGESGSGKSVTALSLMRLLATPPAKIEGEVLFSHSGRVTDLLSLSYAELRKYRGAEVGFIFQEPMTSLNPVFKIKTQMIECLLEHNPKMSKKEAVERSLAMLAKVGIINGRQRFEEYPHQYSGGMRQRVMIAMALLNNPALLIADEPTTALDVTIQAQILDLMIELKEQRAGSAILLITHDMAVVAETCGRVAVMYGGQIQEYAGVKDIFTTAKHPYTIGLLDSIPRFNARETVGTSTGKIVGQKYLKVIPGMVPSLTEMPSGCPFATRCQQDFARKNRKLCLQQRPVLQELAPRHWVRCHQYGAGPAQSCNAPASFSVVRN